MAAYYKAPEAEKLFATTQVAKDRADTFADGLETVSSALSSYATEVRPLVDRLRQLKAEATTFVASVEDDDEWEYDGDKVEEHNRIRDDITATVAAFWAAERACHNKITALWGGTQMVAGDGSDRKDQYGFDAGDMKNAKLPWGDPVEEKHHWYEVGHWVKSFVWDGLIVDGVWGTIKGLGTLVGFGGWEAMKQAWKGLAQLATGLLISAVPIAGTLFWTLPDDKLPSWIRDSRTAMKETGKALVAWDEWGKNPARAAGAVTFNVLTTVFTGGAGGAVSGAGKAGAVAKVLGAAGRAIDPMTYIAKGAGAGLSKIGDIATALKGVGNIEIPPLPANAFELPPGSVKLPDGTFDFPEGATLPDGATRLPDGNVKLPEQTVPLPQGTTKLPTEPGAPAQYLDPEGNILDDAGNVVQRADDAPREPGGTDLDPPAGADNPHTPTPVREPALVGAGAHTADNAAHAADNAGGQTVRLGSNADDGLGDLGRTGDDTGVETGANIPAQAGANIPVQAGAHVPAQAGANIPVQAGANIPAQAGANIPVQAGAHVPVQAGAHVPVQAGADIPVRTGGGGLPGGNVGDNLPGGSAGDNLPGGGAREHGPGPSASHTATDAGRTDVGNDGPGSTGQGGPGGQGGGDADLPGSRGSDDVSTGGGGETPPPAGSLDDLGRTGDDAVGDAGAQADNADDAAAAGRGDQERPLTAAERQEISRQQVERANNDPVWRDRYYEPDGTRRSATARDENGHELTRLRQKESGEWYDPTTSPSAGAEQYKPIKPVEGIRDTVDDAHLPKLDESAVHREAALELNRAERAFKADPSEANAARVEAAQEAAGMEKYNTKPSEKYGEDVVRYHAVPDNFPNAHEVTPPGTGNRRFDHIYENGDRHLLVEAKAPDGVLKDRDGVGPINGVGDDSSGMRVKQGTPQYILATISDMMKRPGEKGLALKLLSQLKNGKLDYVLVQAAETAGEHVGYTMKHFKID
nr:hypothetical protein [Streptomyces abyssomicinicus]